MWLPRTAVAVDHTHLISLANHAMTETRQNLSQQVKGRRGSAIVKAWAHRMLLPRGGDNLSCRAARRLKEVFAADDPTGTSKPTGRSRNNSECCWAPAYWRPPRPRKTNSRNS